MTENEKEQAEPTASQLRHHSIRHPDHPYTPRTRVREGRSVAECSTCVVKNSRAYRRREAGKPEEIPLTTPRKSFVDNRSVITEASVNGITAEQMRQALADHHPDDRIEVIVQPRRRAFGYRMQQVTIIPFAEIVASNKQHPANQRKPF